MFNATFIFYAELNYGKTLAKAQDMVLAVALVLAITQVMALAVALAMAKVCQMLHLLLC